MKVICPGSSRRRPLPNAEANVDTSEATLLDRLQAGDPAAYEELVRTHIGRLLATARRFLASEQEAADAVQDAFLSAFQAIHNFHGNSRLGTWLHRITVNECLMRRRSNIRHPTIDIEQLLPTFDETGHHAQSVIAFQCSPSSAAESAELCQQVRRCIEQLPEPYYTVLMLRDINEFDTEATARILEVSKCVVKTRLHRARQALRTLLEPEIQLD